MEKAYIYAVEEFTIKSDGKRSDSVHNYFSTYEKAVAYIGWAQTCAEKSDGVKVENNFFDAKYEFPNGEHYLIKCEKRMLDAFKIGEA